MVDNFLSFLGDALHMCWIAVNWSPLTWMEVLHNLQIPLGTREVGDYIMGDRETLSTSQVHFYPIFLHDAIHRWITWITWITWRCPEDFHRKSTLSSQWVPMGHRGFQLGPQQFVATSTHWIPGRRNRRRNLARTTSWPSIAWPRTCSWDSSALDCRCNEFSIMTLGDPPANFGLAAWTFENQSMVVFPKIMIWVCLKIGYIPNEIAI